MPGYWLKLYTEVLDDPKYYKLSDSAKLGMYELMMVAKKVDEEGHLPPIEDICFYTRKGADWWQPVIDELRKIDFVVENSTGPIIRKFADRQRPQTATERSQYFREKQREKGVDATHLQLSQNVNAMHIEKDIDIDIDKSREEVEEEEEFPEFSKTYGTSPATSTLPGWHIDIWSKVTGMTGIPGTEIGKVMPALDALHAKYPRDQDLIVYLTRYWQSWIKRPRKDGGGTYSKSNCAWIYDLAVAGDPIPEERKAEIAQAAKSIDIFKEPDPNCPECHGKGFYRKIIDGKERKVSCKCSQKDKK